MRWHETEEWREFIVTWVVEPSLLEVGEVAVAADRRLLAEQVRERLAEAPARYYDSDEAQDGAAFELQAVLALLDEPMITAQELARRLNVSVDTVYRKTQRGEFPEAAVLRIGGVVRYSWSEIRNGGGQ